MINPHNKKLNQAMGVVNALNKNKKNLLAVNVKNVADQLKLNQSI